MSFLEQLQTKYPGAIAWSFGDDQAMADELAALVAEGVKAATCCSLRSYQSEDSPPKIGSYHIILNGGGIPACVIRIVSMRLMRFADVTEEHASKEGEGDLSLCHWRREHKAFFLREGHFSEEMELLLEDFTLIEIL